MKSKLVFALIVFGLSSLVQSASAKERFTIDDGLRMQQINDVAITPDGSSVFYSLSSLDWAENERINTFLLTSADGKTTKTYIGDQSGEQFKFSPNGEYLAFLRGVDAGEEGQDPKPQIFVMPTAGGEAIQVTDHPGTVLEFNWMNSSSAFIFVAEEFFDEDQEKEIQLGADAVFVDEAPNGKNSARFTNFWSASLDDSDPSRITNEEIVIESFDLSPSNNDIAFVARPDTRTNYVAEAELYLMSLGSKQLRQITENGAPESNPIWSPDGKRIAYRAPSVDSFDLRVGSFWILDVASKEARKLNGQRTGELTGAIAWTQEGDALLYNEVHGTNTNLYKLDIKTDTATALTQKAGTLRAESFSKDRKTIVYSYQNFTTPSDLYVSDVLDKNAVKITDANPWVSDERSLSNAQVLSWKGKGGMRIEGAFYPSLNKRAKKVPMILNIHGGPAGVIENAFREDFQALANAGYAVLAPNPRGSTGGGDALLRGLMGEVGDGEYIDLMNGVDYVIENKNVDPDKLGVRGWSWGGVNTSYTITQTQRFKAASIGAMVGSWPAETGPGYNFDLSLWYIGGTPWDNPEEWAKRSSITYVKNVTTPSILFHGGDDETSSTNQSLMFFTALRDIGKAPVRYIKFPRQGHGIREPRLSRIHQTNELQWFKQHINKVDWKIPAPSFE